MNTVLIGAVVNKIEFYIQKLFSILFIISLLSLTPVVLKTVRRDTHSVRNSIRRVECFWDKNILILSKSNQICPNSITFAQI